MRKFITGMLVMLFLIATLAAGGFGYLYFTGQSAANQAKQDKLSADLQVTALQQTVTDLSANRLWKDDGFTVIVSYPFDWVPVLNTNINQEFGMVGDVAGPIIDKYELSFTKGDAVLKFRKLLGGVGGIIQVVDPAQSDFEVITSTKGDLVRVSAKGANEWSYVSKAGCQDAPEPPAAANAVCYDPFFPGFGPSYFASTARLSGTSDATLIAEADAMVLSAQR